MTIPFAQRVTATVAETKQATGIGHTTLYEMMKDGRIKTTHVGKRRLVLVRSVLSLLDPEATAAPAAEAGKAA